MKEKILDVASELINRYGLKKFTMDEIAAQLKISKKTIYKYFSGKEDIIREYFEVSISSDKEGIQQALSQKADFRDKICAIVHSVHRYPLTITLLNEVKMFYPDEWRKVEELKAFKLNSMKNLLEEGAARGIFKSDINCPVLCRMLQEMSGMFLDYDFLLENKLTTMEAIDEALKILFHGVLKNKAD